MVEGWLISGGSRGVSRVLTEPQDLILRGTNDRLSGTPLSG